MYQIVDHNQVKVDVSHKRLALFGGSFDPFHKTHLSIAKYVVEHCNVDYVVLIPTKQNPFKQIVESDQNRLTMLVEAINNYSNILLCHFELNAQDTISYAYRTVQYIREQYSPVLPLQLIIGADILLNLDKWSHIYELLEWVRLLVVPRTGYNSHISQWLKNRSVTIKILDEFPCSDISSSLIRTALYQSHETIKNLVEDSVFTYIQEHKLYLEKRKAT